MSDPKYNKYESTVRFDDNNIVDIDLQPDTENIRVLLNDEEVTGGGLPAVDSSDNGDVLTVVSGEWTNAAPASQLPAVSGSDNGDVLTVVSGEWTNAAPASQLPAVSGSDNGDVLTVVEGVWEKAAPAGGSSNVMVITITVDDTTSPRTVSFDKTASQVNAHLAADDNNIIKFKYVDSGESFYYDVEYSYIEAGTLFLGLISLSAMSITNMVVYPGAVIIDSDSITWDDTIDGNTTGVYPGASYNIDYNNGN